MKLEKLTAAHVHQAVALYVERAWPEGIDGPAKRKYEGLEGRMTLKSLRDVFDVVKTDSNPGADGSGYRRYTLRLGNHRYPWMKFVIQEYLVEGEYFFSVDTHDELRIDPSMPDYESWCELQRYNRELKKDIEAAWDRSDLPTHGDLRALCEGLARMGESESRPEASLEGKRILVVDDDENVCCGAAAMLGARGFEVETAFDGRQVLDRMEQDPLPDLVVLDFAMPEFDGEEVMRRLRADDRTKDVPILLATASRIELQTIERASGLLHKPYPREVLYRMIDGLLTGLGRKSGQHPRASA